MAVHHLLEAHLANSNGFSLRDMAAVRGGHASTYSRQVAACEDLTEHPEWSEVIDLLHTKRKEVDPPRIDLTRTDILDTFELNEQELYQTFRQVAPFVKHEHGQIVMGNMPKGVALIAGQKEPKISFPKAEGLCFLTMELIWPTTEGKEQARLFTGAPNLSDADFWAAPRKPGVEVKPGRKPKQKPKYEDKFIRPYDSLLRRKFITQDEVNMAREFEQLYIAKDHAAKQIWEYLEKRNYGDIHNVLMAFCVENRGFEEYEKERGWAARSGKVVFKVALQQLTYHLGREDAPPNPLYGTRTLKD